MGGVRRVLEQVVFLSGGGQEGFGASSVFAIPRFIHLYPVKVIVAQ